jgi:hypothetical protein
MNDAVLNRNNPDFLWGIAQVQPGVQLLHLLHPNLGRDGFLPRSAGKLKPSDRPTTDDVLRVLLFFAKHEPKLRRHMTSRQLTLLVAAHGRPVPHGAVITAMLLTCLPIDICGDHLVLCAATAMSAAGSMPRPLNEISDHQVALATQ